MDCKELIHIVKECGVAGAGGAGFPTYAKLDKKADTIILNCAECEPLIKVHRQLLQKYSFEIMSTLQALAEILDVNNVIIGVKEAYTKTIDAVKAYLPSFPKVQIAKLPEVYPMGDEVILIYEILGKVVPPGGIPLDIGVVVFNPETIWNLYQALNFKVPVTHKYLTITGEVTTPITTKVPIGMTVLEAITLAGGSKIKDPEYIMGGPMTGQLVPSYETITKTTNAIIVLPKTHPVVLKKKGKTSIEMKRAMASCCQCEMCTDLCPRNLLGHPITPHMFMRAATSMVTNDVASYIDTLFCCSCGLCEMFSCPQSLAPRKLIAEYKGGLRKRGIAAPKGLCSKPVKKSRSYRLVPMERLISRLDLVQYDKEAPLDENPVDTNLVKIKLSQHVGAMAKPIVLRNDKVECGQKIASAKEESLSIPVHSSINGEVIDVNGEFIMIRKMGLN